MNKEELEHYKGFDYSTLVDMFIRSKYSVSDELAIQRQRETKPEEYQEYYAFCEECKAKAKALQEG